MAKKVAFLHIPKTGGVSVESVLKKNFRSDEVAPCYFPHEFRTADVPSIASNHSLVIGHFDFDVLGALGDDFIKLVVFREPLALLISLYNHAASRPSHRLNTAIREGELGFSAFCQNIQGSKNILSKYLLGRSTYWRVVDEANGRQAARSAAEIATTHLLLFNYIGMTCELNTFINTVSMSLFNRPAPAPPRLNSSPARISRDTLDEKDVHAFEAANEVDISVFEAINSFYRRRVGDISLFSASFEKSRTGSNSESDIGSVDPNIR